MSFSEAAAMRVRLLLAGVWALIIASLFHDPWSPVLTGPDSPIGPLALDSVGCVAVQNHCWRGSAYPIGAPLFWGLILPVLVAVLFLFGHELWRRICPLSLFSQVARRFDWVRRRPAVNPDAPASVRRRAARVRPDSWLARHHLSLQFGLFYLALCGRILFVNSHRLSLALFMLAFIVAAVVVGFLYDGKTWCHYFCPVAPVEAFYTGPRGLIASKAHVRSNPAVKVSQSMCRTAGATGEGDKSACVACTAQCIDIDAERVYWLGLMQPSRQRLYYGYAGLVLAYFAYYYLYAGGWGYYLSGFWSHEPAQHAHLLDPGLAHPLLLFGQALTPPKLLAVPLVLGIGALGGYGLGCGLEAMLARRLDRAPGAGLDREILRHRCFSLTTFAVFNFFFAFSGYNFRVMLPAPLPTYVPVALCGFSALWLYRTWHRHPDLYSQEVLEQKRLLRERQAVHRRSGASAVAASAQAPLRRFSESGRAG